MSLSDECEHGSLRRSCEICQRDDDIRELKRAAVTAKAVLDGALLAYRNQEPPLMVEAWSRSILHDLETAVKRYLQVDGSHGCYDAIEAGIARRRLLELVGEVKPITLAEIVRERAT